MAETISKDDNGVLLQCECKVKKKQYSVILTNTELSWHITDGGKQKDLQCVGVVDLLSVNMQNPSQDGSAVDAVNVSFVKQGKNLHLKRYAVVFTCADSQLATQLHKLIGDLIANNKQRPRKLLVFINPISGRSKGRSVYEQKVAPILQDAGIQTEVIVTERAHHTEEILATYDIKSISGLVVVGGDGLYHEAVNGIMKRLANDRGLNVNDPNTALPDIDLPMGLIPCGTGNGIAYDCYGSYDVVTAALSIAIGYQMKNSMMAVHSGGQLLAYSSLLVGYGIWGDIIHATETRRELGIMRYPIAIGKYMLIKPMRRLNMTVQTVSDQEQNKGQTSGTNIDENNDVVKQTIESGVVDAKDIEVANDVKQTIESGLVDTKDIEVGNDVKQTIESGVVDTKDIEVGNDVKQTIESGLVDAKDIEVGNDVKQTIGSEVVDAKDIEVGNELDNSASVDDKGISKSSRTKEPIIGSLIITHTPTSARGNVPATQPSLSLSHMRLNKPSGRMKMWSFMYQLITLNFEAINSRPDVVVLPGQEWSVKLDELSEPDSKNWQLEHIINIDGEIFKLQQPEYQAKLFPGKIKLFSNMPYSTGRDINKK